MITVTILIDTVEKVKRFSAAISRVEVECELIEGVHIIDARSIMGIFSLDLSTPVQLTIHSDNKDLLNPIREYIVEA